MRALAPLLPVALPVALAVALAGCGTLRDLSEIGGPPAMTATADPRLDPGWRPVTMPMPVTSLVTPEANTLWRTGSRAFFKDQRAALVGDLVTVVVNITDAADFKDATTTTRNGSESLGTPNLFGLENRLSHILPTSKAASLVSTASANAGVGSGEIRRNESVSVRLAGVVTQVLPNGNLVVAARQEVRVNHELRELEVSGVIRPQDIASDNTVLHDRMAEARISYGGRGQLTTVQSPRYGQQALDILLPF